MSGRLDEFKKQYQEDVYRYGGFTMWAMYIGMLACVLTALAFLVMLVLAFIEEPVIMSFVLGVPAVAFGWMYGMHRWLMREVEDD